MKDQSNDMRILELQLKSNGYGHLYSKEENLIGLQQLLIRSSMENICPLCKREIPDNCKSKHHLIPVLKGGKSLGTVTLHKICHDKIHSLFTERQLQVQYNTIEKLLQEERVDVFVRWVQNKPIDFYDSSRKFRK